LISVSVQQYLKIKANVTFTEYARFNSTLVLYFLKLLFRGSINIQHIHITPPCGAPIVQSRFWCSFSVPIYLSNQIKFINAKGPVGR